jgi:hypothetical protein
MLEIETDGATFDLLTIYSGVVHAARPRTMLERCKIGGVDRLGCRAPTTSCYLKAVVIIVFF